MYQYMEYLKEEYPGLVTVEDIGRSFENRSLYVAKVSSGPNRPAIWIDGGEWVVVGQEKGGGILHNPSTPFSLSLTFTLSLSIPRSHIHYKLVFPSSNQAYDLSFPLQASMLGSGSPRLQSCTFSIAWWSTSGRIRNCFITSTGSSCLWSTLMVNYCSLVCKIILIGIYFTTIVVVEEQPSLLFSSWTTRK